MDGAQKPRPGNRAAQGSLKESSEEKLGKQDASAQDERIDPLSSFLISKDVWNDSAFSANLRAWSEDYSRTIAADMRYVLWVMQKFGRVDFLFEDLGTGPRGQEDRQMDYDQSRRQARVVRQLRR
jgi:hypothetical protein